MTNVVLKRSRIRISSSDVVQSRGLVQNQEVRKNRPGDGDALTLSGGQADAFLADDGLVAFGAIHDEVVRVGGFRGGDDLGFGRALSRAYSIFS